MRLAGDRIGGQTTGSYDTVADQQAVAQAHLAILAANPQRVRRLCGWDWLTDALDSLPAASPPP